MQWFVVCFDVTQSAGGARSGGNVSSSFDTAVVDGLSGCMLRNSLMGLLLTVTFEQTACIMQWNAQPFEPCGFVGCAALPA